MSSCSSLVLLLIMSWKLIEVEIVSLVVVVVEEVEEVEEEEVGMEMKVQID